MSKSLPGKTDDTFSITPIWVEKRAGLLFECVSSIEEIDLYIRRDKRFANTVSRIYLSETCAEVIQGKKCKLVAQDDFVSLLLESYIFFTYEEPSAYYKILRDFIVSRNDDKRVCR